MDQIRDEACALKVARALSYINFASLEKWFGHPGFIKIFQGLKEEGTDLGWTILLGAIECAAAGDRHLPKEIIYRILRENRVTVQHLQDLFPDSAPVRPHPGGFRVGGMEGLPQEAIPEMDAAVKGFCDGQIAMEELGDELYRLHTGEMKDTLYYHALLAAKSVRHPISAHMLWKALRLLPPGSLRDESVTLALTRLEEFQGEHLSAAMRGEAPSQSSRSGQARSTKNAPQASFGPGHPAPLPAGDYRERAARFLQTAKILAYGNRASRMAALTGYDESRINGLMEPFLLRCYCGEGDSLADKGLMLAIGPPEVDKPAILQGVAQGLGLRFMQVGYFGLRCSWMGELESELLRLLDSARELGGRGRGRPAMLVLSEDGPAGGIARRDGSMTVSPQDVVGALSGLLSGPRRREALGEEGGASVIAVAAMSFVPGLEHSLRGQATIIRLEPPGAPELERLLVLNIVGRYWLCDLDGISFSRLGEEAVGLAPGDIARVAQRAKLRALDRRARQLGTAVATAPGRLRAEISRSYLITQEDLSSFIEAEKLARRRTAPSRSESSLAPGAPHRQTDINGWANDKRED